MIQTTAVLYDPFGARYAAIADFIDGGSGAALDYTLTSAPGAIGACVLTVPPRIDTGVITEDWRIGIWRSIHGRAAVLDGGALFLVRQIEDRAQSSTLTALHATTLLSERRAAYPGDTGFIIKSGPADNLIKAFARQNMGSAITSIRDGSETQANLSAWLTIAGDVGQGATVAIDDVARQPLADICTRLADLSAQRGVYLTYDIVAASDTTLELRTYIGQRGVDRRQSRGNSLRLSEASGTLENVRVVRDYTRLRTMSIAGGAGDGSGQAIATAEDTARMARSPFGRREHYVSSTGTGDLVALQGVADSALRSARETVVLQGDVRDTDVAIRGIHYDVGDLATAVHPRTGLLLDVRIEQLRVSIGGGRDAQQLTVRSL